MCKVGSSPAFRRNNRQNPHPPKAPPDPSLNDDLHGKTAQELKEIAEVTALTALIAQTRRPTRHATAVVSAARNLLDFSSAKPAAATTISAPDGGPVQSEHVIRFVKPAE